MNESEIFNQPKTDQPNKKMMGVCPWCHKEMGEIEGGREGIITTRVCPNCLKKIETEMKSNIPKIMELNNSLEKNK